MGSHNSHIHPAVMRSSPTSGVKWGWMESPHPHLMIPRQDPLVSTEKLWKKPIKLEGLNKMQSKDIIYQMSRF